MSDISQQLKPSGSSSGVQVILTASPDLADSSAASAILDTALVILEVTLILAPPWKMTIIKSKIFTRHYTEFFHLDNIKEVIQFIFVSVRMTGGE